MDIIPVLLIFVPILFSLIIYLIKNSKFNWLIFVGQMIQNILVLIYIYYIKTNEVHKIVMGGWDKGIGVSLKNDKLSMVFMFMAIIIWTVVLIYSWDKRKHDFKYLFFVLFVEGTFFGLIQSNDFFTIFVFIEFTTIISTILITYKKDGYSVRAGFFYLMFNSVGMFYYLIGIMIIYNMSGTLNMDLTSARIAEIGINKAVIFSYVFIISAAGVKSAFFPVYNWLPKAYSAAPAAISALLGGLLSKIGIYVFIRMNMVFNLNIMNDFFLYIGLFTAVLGSVFSMCQTDIKTILAFSSISHIGVIVAGISKMSGEVYVGAIFYMFNHALFKSLLFLATGIIINEYGKRRVSEIRGVYKELPYVTTFMIIGMLSITSAPFLGGAVGKGIIKSFTNSDYTKFIIEMVGLMTVISYIKILQIFPGDFKSRRKTYKYGNVAMGILAVFCIVLGTYYNPVGENIFGLKIPNVDVNMYEKIEDYILNLIIGYTIYKLFIENDNKIVRKIRHIKLSFSETNFMLVSFIVVMLMWTIIK